MTPSQQLILWIIFAAFLWYAVRPVAVYFFGTIVQWLAKLGKFFTTLPEPGRFTFIMVGGNLKRIVENVIDFDIDPDTGLFVPARRHKKEESFFEKRYGVTWIGLFGEVKVFPNWQWIEFRQKEDGSGNLMPELVATMRREDVSHFLHQFTFAVPTKDVELAGNDQAEFNSLITVLVMDPETAFFKNKNWVETLSGFIQAIVKDWATDKEFNTAKEAARADLRNSELTRAILAANTDYQYFDPLTGETRDGGFLRILGIQVVSHFLQSVEATGPVAKAQAANREAELLGEAKKTAATKEGEAAVIKAQKEAEALEKLGAAKKQFIQDTIVNPCSGPNGAEIARILRAQAFTGEGSKITTLVEGGGVVPSLPVTNQRP